MPRSPFFQRWNVLSYYSSPSYDIRDAAAPLDFDYEMKEYVSSQ